jgi:hypothetical protein
MTPERTLVPKFFAKPRLRGMKPADETPARARHASGASLFRRPDRPLSMMPRQY